jgi:hypothetical protein
MRDTKRAPGPRTARAKRAPGSHTPSAKRAFSYRQRAMSEFWEVHEFARLAAGLDWDAKEADLDATTVAKVRDIEAMANRSLQAKTLNYQATPGEWVVWAAAMAIEVPAPLREAVRKHKPLPARHAREGADTGDGPITKSAQTKQHNTMLRLIGGLALATYGSLDKPYEAARVISADLAAKGIEVSADTVANYLKEATPLLNQKSPPKP